MSDATTVQGMTSFFGTNNHMFGSISVFLVPATIQIVRYSPITLDKLTNYQNCPKPLFHIFS